MDYLYDLLNFFLHLDSHLNEWITQYGKFTYGILFSIIFAETGFVFTPFLPGDSLLFAAGAFAARGSLDVNLLVFILSLAAISGDTVNYFIGHFIGKKILEKNTPFIKREHVEKTHQFFERHGGKTIIIARFIPFIRTFAPFVAGIGAMNYSKFIIYNIAGGIGWCFIFLYGGYLFGNLSFVKNNFSLVILAIIIISIMPGIIEYIKSLSGKKKVEIH